MPYAALAVNIITNAGMAIKKQHEKEKQNSFASHAQTLHDASELVKEVSSLLTQRHRMQILKLTEGSVVHFAESFVKRIFDAMNHVPLEGKIKSVLVGTSTCLISVGECFEEMAEESTEKLLSKRDLDLWRNALFCAGKTCRLAIERM